jgi:hypothetical protein
MGQAPSKKIVEANEFILKDDSGNMRARLFMNPTGNPVMVLLNKKGEAGAELVGGTAMKMTDGTTAAGGGMINVYDAQGQRRGSLWGTSDTVMLSLTQKQEKQEHLVSTMMQPGEAIVSDAQGFSAILGENIMVTPRTGEEHKTSAASLILFDKERNVLWKAP